jgi:hydrogenase maturation protease
MQKSRFDKQCAVLGIGNVILGDEGIGVHLVKRLRRKYHFTPEVAIIDGGCGGLSLYFVF